MFPRSSYRYTTIVLTCILFLTLATLFESFLQSHSHNRLSILSVPQHHPRSSQRKIKAFWAEWAAIFDQAKPTTPKIQFDGKASTDGSDQANGDRVPGPSLLELSSKDVASMQASHKVLMKQLQTVDGEQVKRLFSGTGVVIVAGGEYFPPALTTIKMLRRSGSKLPVEIFLQSHSEYEADVCDDFLLGLNAECIVLEDFLRNDAPFSVTHFQLKALAMLFSSFETILFLDSDCMPLRNPAELLDSEPFTSTGLLTWPDYWIATEDPVFYTIAGLPSFPSNMPARSSESGQLVVSKSQHLSTLLLAAYYNVFGPSHFYPLLSQGALGQGDKETFLAAAVVLGNPYYRVRERVGTVGYFDDEGDFHGGAMVQHHAGDDHAMQLNKSSISKVRPFFLHANYPKMNLGHLVDGPRRRLWGPEDSMFKRFGLDLERVVWNEMVEPGCGLATVLRDWTERENVCDRAREHWQEVFLRNQ